MQNAERKMQIYGGSAVRVALMVAVAYSTHLLIDWLSVDNLTPRGLQLLWPFSDRFFISGLDWFPATERHEILSYAAFRTKFIAASTELAAFLPVLGLLWLVRVKTAAGLATEIARRHHAP